MTYCLPSPPSDLHIRIACLGDIVGRAGRDAVKSIVPILRKKAGAHMVIANGENSAGGIGIVPTGAHELLQAGVDVITTGNHVWRHKEFRNTLAKESRLLRPANYPNQVVGKGLGVYTIDGCTVAVINLIGRVYMEPLDCPFQAADTLLLEAKEHTPLIVVDFHAEATSEKRAMAHYIDGRASLLFGTHTHVQTADACISAAGTAAITDLGMCGVEQHSVLGMHPQRSIARFMTGLPGPFVEAKGPGTINGILVDIERGTGKAAGIFLLRQGTPCVYDACKTALG